MTYTPYAPINITLESNVTGNGSNNNSGNEKNNLNFYSSTIILNFNFRANNNISNVSDKIDNCFARETNSDGRLSQNDTFLLNNNLSDFKIIRGQAREEGSDEIRNCYLIVDKGDDKITSFFDPKWSLLQDPNAEIKCADANLSVEDIENVYTQLDNDQDVHTKQIFALYDLCGRFPDSEGLNFHTNNLRNRKATLEETVATFSNSSEFQKVFQDENIKLQNSPDYTPSLSPDNIRDSAKNLNFLTPSFVGLIFPVLVQNSI